MDGGLSSAVGDRLEEDYGHHAICIFNYIGASSVIIIVGEEGIRLQQMRRQRAGRDKCLELTASNYFFN